MSTSLNRGRLRRPGRGLKTEEKAVKTDSINRLTHRNSDTPPTVRPTKAHNKTQS